MNEPLSLPATNAATNTITAIEPGSDYSKPKRLIEHATEDPLYVIKEVFERERLDYIKYYCQDWFHVSLINEGGYYEEDERAGLVAFYQALLPLLEALFIVNQQRQPENSERDLSKLPPDVVEELTSRDKIVLLSKEQVENPMKVIVGFCRQFSKEYSERELWHWLEAGITYGGTYPENINEAVLLTIYDYIQCLSSAAYEIARRESLKPLPVAAIQEDKTGILEKVIAILAETCQPEKIFLLHFASSTDETKVSECNFLVLLKASPAVRPYKEYQATIDTKCSELASVLLTFNTTKEAYRYLQAGHLFYSVVCKPGKLVYDNNKEPLPGLSSFDTCEIIKKARNLFEVENNKANDFLEGARYYYTAGKPGCAAFLLHQAAECILLGFLQSLTGHNYFTHNLVTLLQKCRSFTDGLQAAFPNDTPKETELLKQLNRAYVRTRYHNDYTISDEDLTTLVDKVTMLMDAATQAVKEQLIGFEKLFKP